MIKPSAKTTITGISTSQRTDTDINDLILDHMNKVPGLTTGFVRKLANARKRRILARLQTEPPVRRYPYGEFPWVNDRQRVAAIIKMRKSGNMPYERSHTLIAKWDVKVTFNQRDQGGAVWMENTSPVAPYVYGPDQQPFHRASGWENMRDVAADETNAFEEDLASGFITLADPYAGVPQGGL